MEPSKGGHMYRYGCVRLLPAVILLGSLVSCVSDTRDSDRRPLPSYASPIVVRGFQSWTVRCPLQSITGPDDGDTSIFYKSDGTEKTSIEFCDEYDSSSRIREDDDEQ
jgi:hypothetical protein